MKRSPLRRRTPLRPGKPLEARTELAWLAWQSHAAGVIELPEEVR